jgi:hypothetical protein
LLHRARLLTTGNSLPTESPLATESLARLRTSGLFRPQAAFCDRVIFEALSGVSGVADGEPFTVGVAKVKPKDATDGRPLILTVIARETEG